MQELKIKTDEEETKVKTDEEKRKELEESLDVELPDSAEVASALEFSKETYSEAHKIKSLSKQNSEIWETN